MAHFSRAIKKPLAFTCIGGKETGKSALIETIACNYPAVIDIFAARDNEGLSWLRSPFKTKVLFLKGKTVKIDCNCADVINVQDVKVKDLDNYTAIISASSFYSTIREEWISVGQFMDRLWYRTHWSAPMCKCILIREGASLLASRHMLGEDQKQAINSALYMLREMRHCGFAVCLDTLRWYGVDRDYRAVTDYTFIKATGTEGLPDDIHFVYRYYNAAKIQQMPPQFFVVLTREGSIGHGSFGLPNWHKKEYEDMLALFDIQIEYEEKDKAEPNRNAKVNDHEHIRIIKLRRELPENERGMETIGKKIMRSSRTILEHIRHHNTMVETAGACDRCARVNGAYVKDLLD